jgi:uncharacterized protein (TIGR00369 family)
MTSDQDLTGGERRDCDAQTTGVVLGPFDQKLGVKVVSESVDRLVATMPVEGNTQGYGRLHGGASLALGEFLGSWAALLWAQPMGKSAVGLDVSATHVRAARSGLVTGVAVPVHLGRRMTSHDVTITDDQGRLVSLFHITNLLIDPEDQ